MALAVQASRQTGGEADRLFALAVAKYEAALAIKPDIPEVLIAWSAALADHATKKTGEESERLLALAEVKCEAALAIKPDMDVALTILEHIRYDQAQQSPPSQK
jgi:lipoprotein NlpI